MTGPDLRERIAAIKCRVRLEDEVLRRGIELRAANGTTGRLQGCCPFHDDSSPSFMVYLDSQRFYCFGCGTQGDVIDFIQQYETCSLAQALERLSPDSLSTTPLCPRPDRSGRSAPARQAPGRLKPSIADHRSTLSSALELYERQLWRTPHVLRYLYERGLTEAGIRRARLGYSDGQVLRFALAGKEQPWAAARAAGLLSRSGREWLAGRLIVADLDEAGQATWMIGRLVPGTSNASVTRSQEKYLGLSLPKPLLGYRQALHRVSTGQAAYVQGIILVEGALDYVLLHQWALPVLPTALLGTYPSRRQTASLFHLQERSRLPLIDWHDADAQGQQAAWHLFDEWRGRPRLLFPSIAGIKDPGELAQCPDHEQRLRHAWHALTDGGEEICH